MPFIYSSTTVSNEYGTFSCQFTGLSNKICTTSQFTPPDGDGNIYRTIKIGSQVWMSESLRTTKFQDGTTLLDNPNNDPVDSFTWADASSSSKKYWAYVHDDSNSKAIEGLLYNQYAVTGSTQGAAASSSLCPAGWHIPTLSEANTFVANIGTNAAARHPGIIYWVNLPLQFQGTNTSGFSALGSDVRFIDGSYSPNTGYGNSIWATSVRIGIDIGVAPGSSPTIITYTEPFDERYGLSVRCIKD